MNQSEFFNHKAIIPDYSLTEPLIWIKQISFWKVLEDEKPIRQILFRKGLNIIATEIAGEGDTEPVGHDVGKTMLMRIIRYCLGEERYADKETHRSVVGQLPNSYVLAHFYVDGNSWCIARPLGIGSSRLDSWCRRVNDIEQLRSKEGAYPYSDFVNELSQVSRNCYADIGLPLADNRKANWKDLLGWLSRDQDCLNLHHGEWRVTESQAGSRVLKKTDAYLVMRMALDILGESEIKRVEEHEALKQKLDKEEKERVKLNVVLEGIRRYSISSCKDRGQKLVNPADDALFGATIINHAQNQIKALQGLKNDDGEKENIQTLEVRRDVLIRQEAQLEERIDQLKALKETQNKTISEMEQQESDTFFASTTKPDFKCEFYPNKETAAERGCPGLDPVTLKAHPDDPDIYRQKEIEQSKSQMREIDHHLKQLKIDCEIILQELNNTKQTILSFRKTQEGITKSIGHWEEIEQQGKRYRKHHSELTQLNISLEGREKKMEDSSKAITAARTESVNKIAVLSQCYEAVVRQILSDEAIAHVRVDNNGIMPIIDNKSPGGTTLKTCSKVLGFDFACLAASLCGLGFLPRLWMHDSPRSADTEDQLYHTVMEVSLWLENFYENKPIPFQQIWTTTSAPPKKLDNDTYVRARLSARSPEGKLLGQSF